MLIDLAGALAMWLAGFALAGRFIAPRWKVWGKLGFLLVATAALSAWLGHWALAVVAAHQGLGIGGHIRWCRRHGIHWLTCQPRGKYLELRPWAAGDGFGGDG